MMELILQPRNPAASFTGFAVVVVLHIAVVLGLMFGLARTHHKPDLPLLIDFVPLVDPLPREPPAHDPRPVALQPVPVIVPRDILIDIQDAVVDTISPPTRDPAPVPGASQSLRGPFGAPTPDISTGIGIACPNAQGIRSSMRYPAQARRDGLQGDVLARFVVGAGGEIRDIDIVSSSSRAFNAAVISAVRQFNCIAQGREVTVEVPFSFRLE